jgi:hypothetical protein
MTNYYKKFAAIIALLGITGMSAAYATDSTKVKLPNAKPVIQSYLLASSKVTTDRATGVYTVNHIATSKRCSADTHPLLTTSISSISVYGAAQAIEGVNNSLTLSPSYILSGSVSAPVNIALAGDNGVTVNWQIWCEPNKTA